MAQANTGNKYKVIVYPAIMEIINGRFFVSFIDLTCCTASGDDRQQARRNAEDSLGYCLQLNREANYELPLPSSFYTTDREHLNAAVEHILVAVQIADLGEAQR